MGFSSVKAFADAMATDGSGWTGWIHKTGAPVLTGVGAWGDLSMAPGIPKYNAYVGDQATGTPLYGAGNFGVFTGGDVAPKSRHIAQIGIQAMVAGLIPSTHVIADYLMHYPLIDMDSTDVQVMDNPLPLPRYADGEGVRAFLVTTTPQSAVARCDISYTNSKGVSGRTVSIYTAASAAGQLQTQQAASGAVATATPFIPLVSGDTGIRSIDSITMQASAGGFCAVVLCKPLATVTCRELATWTEVSYLKDKATMPMVLDGACLYSLFSTGATPASGVIRAQIEFVYGGS